MEREICYSICVRKERESAVTDKFSHIGFLASSVSRAGVMLTYFVGKAGKKG